MSLITSAEVLYNEFPVNKALIPALELAGKQAFAREFVQARDAVEHDYYTLLDRQTTPLRRTRKFLGALVNPVIGRPVKDPGHFYETFGRLMRWAWLSISVGLYTGDIHALSDPATRLHAAQVNTIDVAWRAALSRLQNTPGGLLVEIGTGRGNSVARLARLLPQTRIVSVTISAEQAEIARQVARIFGAANVEVRHGDLFDRAVTDDLIGQADAVTAIEVTGHFRPEQKGEGIGLMARMLKPGAPLSLLDTALQHPLPAMMRRFYANQSWYFGSHETYLDAFVAAGVDMLAYVNHAEATFQTFYDTTTVLRARRDRLRAEFGRLMALIWPELPKSVYLRAVQQVDYIHVLGIKLETQPIQENRSHAL